MQTNTVTPLYSESFDQLRRYFLSVEPPYTLRDIQQFNAIYRGIYPTLSREEKRRAEGFVDKLIEGVENKHLAPKIYGVV